MLQKRLEQPIKLKNHKSLPFDKPVMLQKRLERPIKISQHKEQSIELVLALFTIQERLQLPIRNKQNVDGRVYF